MAYAPNQQRYLFDRATQVKNITLDQKVMELIGTGIKYPFAFNEIYGGLESSKRTITVPVSALDDNSAVYYYNTTVQDSSGLDKINGSIHHILSTPIGSRFFNPEFGSMLPSLVFEPYDQMLKDQIFLYTVEALQRWEKRIRIKKVGFDDTYMDLSQIGIGIEYALINSYITGLYVYPFVLRTEPVK